MWSGREPCRPHHPVDPEGTVPGKINVLLTDHQACTGRADTAYCSHGAGTKKSGLSKTPYSFWRKSCCCCGGSGGGGGGIKDDDDDVNDDEARSAPPLPLTIAPRVGLLLEAGPLVAPATSIDEGDPPLGLDPEDDPAADDTEADTEIASLRRSRRRLNLRNSAVPTSIAIVRLASSSSRAAAAAAAAALSPALSHPPAPLSPSPSLLVVIVPPFLMPGDSASLAIVRNTEEEDRTNGQRSSALNITQKHSSTSQ